jgi:hypothetical protein
MREEGMLLPSTTRTPLMDTDGVTLRIRPHSKDDYRTVEGWEIEQDSNTGIQDDGSFVGVRYQVRIPYFGEQNDFDKGLFAALSPVDLRFIPDTGEQIRVEGYVSRTKHSGGRGKPDTWGFQISFPGGRNWPRDDFHDMFGIIDPREKSDIEF